MRSNVTRSIHTLDTRLLRIIDPQQPALGIQPAPERLMKVSRELSAEIEEQRIALKRLTLRKQNTLQLLRRLVTLQRHHTFRPHCNIKLRQLRAVVTR